MRQLSGADPKVRLWRGPWTGGVLGGHRGLTATRRGLSQRGPAFPAVPAHPPRESRVLTKNQKRW